MEDVKVGDRVHTYNTVTGVVEPKEVTAVFVRQSDHVNYLTIEDENDNIQVIEVTDGHPFWVVTNTPDLARAAREYADGFYHENIGVTEFGYWVEAKDLRTGDVFLGANGELSTLVAKKRVAFPEGIKVYNFTVDGNHNYFVIAKDDEFGQTCILVHNGEYEKPAPQTWYQWGAGWGHFGLDAAGCVPLFGAIPDGINAGWYWLEGDKVNATFSAAGLLPFVGEGAKGVKYGKKALDAAAKAKAVIPLPTNAAARREAMRQANVQTSLPNNYKVEIVHGKNPNLKGPKGEPSEILRSTDMNGKPVEIQHHLNGHSYPDGTSIPPHYHDPSHTIHITYPGGGQ